MHMGHPLRVLGGDFVVAVPQGFQLLIGHAPQPVQQLLRP